MCKFNPKNDSRFMDPCMKDYIGMINRILKPRYETKSCCCGHGKYPKTIVIGLKRKGVNCFELFTGKLITRNKRFYKKDKEGYYYLPEIC